MNLLILCTNPALGLGVIRCLGSAGHRVHAMGVGERPPYRFSRHCAAYVPFDACRLLNPSAALAAQINRYCHQNDLQLLIPCDLPTTLVLDRLRSQLDVPLFPISPASTVQRLHDKWAFAGFLKSLNLPHPHTCLIERLEDLRNVDLSPPLLVKPRFGEGGQGIERVDEPARLISIVRAAGKGVSLLAQDFIPGRDVDISLLADHGRIVAWTMQSPLHTPGHHEFLRDSRILAIAEMIVAASDYHGGAHIDMRVGQHDGQPQVLEFNPRFWGSLTHSLWMGINFPQLGIALANRSLPSNIPNGPRGIRGTFDADLFGIVKSLAVSRPPATLAPESLPAWEMFRSDPLPELLGRFHGIRPRHACRLAARREMIARQLVSAAGGG